MSYTEKARQWISRFSFLPSKLLRCLVAGFWTSQTGRHPVMEALKEEADAIAAESRNPKLLEHMQG